MSKKIIGFVASIAMVLSLVGAQSASALTAGDIAMLQAAGIISATQAATLMSGMTPSSVSAGYNFTRSLTLGATGADVKALQQFLNANGAIISASGAGAPGSESTYFGSKTKTALAKFQAANGIAPAVGYFGSITRAKINSMGGTVTGTTGTVISGTDLSVSLAATSPLASALVAGQAAANLAEFTFTNKSAAPAVVTNVTLQRMGVSADTALTNVYLYSGAVRLTDAASVSSGRISFNAASGIFTIPAGSSMNVSVRADISGGANGQLIAVALTGVTASLPVSAVYPISGSSMSIFSSGDLATVTLTLSNSVLGANMQILAGAQNQTVWSTSMNLSGRAVYLKSLALKVIGSVPQNALQNVKLYVAGVQVAQAMGMDANGMITFDLTSAPYKIDSSRTIEVHADVVNGSSRTFSVQLQNASDFMVVDSNYNVGVTPVQANSQTTTTFTVSIGSVTVSSDPSLQAQNVVTGSTNVPLARYTFKAYGEDMKISYLKLAATDQLDNVSLYANGVQIGSTQTISATTTLSGSLVSTSSNLFTYSLGSSLIIPAGQAVTVEVKGDIKYNGTNATTSSNPVMVALVGYANGTQGSYSSTLHTAPLGESDGQIMTVVGAGMTFGANASVSDTTVVPQTQNALIGSYMLQANSSEAIRISSLTVNVGGTITPLTGLTNLTVKTSDGTILATPLGQVGAANNLSLTTEFTIAANASKIINIFADIQNVAGYTATTSLSIDGYGVGSNVSISQTAVGQTISVLAGSLATPTKNSTSQTTSQFVIGGSATDLLNIQLTSINGDSIIKEMYFAATGSVVAVSVNGVSAQFNAGVATITGVEKLVRAGQNGSVAVPVTVTYKTVGDGGATSSATSSVALTGYKYVSGNVSTTTTLVTAVGSNNAFVVASKPVVSLIAAPTQVSLTTGSPLIGSIKVTANASGQIGVVSIPLSITTSAATLSGITVVIDETDYTLTNGVDATISTSGITFFSTTTQRIGAGQSATFQIYGNTVSGLTAGASGISLGLGSAASFLWQDIAGTKTGADVATSTGSYIISYPVTSVSIVN